MTGGDIAVETVAHVFRAGHLSRERDEWREPRESLARLIDIAAELGARSIYMLTGGHGGLRWEEAADCFCEAIAPCVDQAKAAGIELAIENASALYAEIHIAHSLADTITLAEMAGVGVCIELFFCWAEAGLPALFARAMPRCQLVQLMRLCLRRPLAARAGGAGRRRHSAASTSSASLLRRRLRRHLRPGTARPAYRRGGTTPRQWRAPPRTQARC